LVRRWANERYETCGRELLRHDKEKKNKVTQKFTPFVTRGVSYRKEKIFRKRRAKWGESPCGRENEVAESRASRIQGSKEG